MNAIIRGPRLHLATLPLVKLMRHGDLSWSDREEIGDALLVCLRHFDDMEAERQFHEQAANTATAHQE